MAKYNPLGYLTSRFEVIKDDDVFSNANTLGISEFEDLLKYSESNKFATIDIFKFPTDARESFINTGFVTVSIYPLSRISIQFLVVDNDNPPSDMTARLSEIVKKYLPKAIEINVGHWLTYINMENIEKVSICNQPPKILLDTKYDGKASYIYAGDRGSYDMQKLALTLQLTNLGIEYNEIPDWNVNGY